MVPLNALMFTDGRPGHYTLTEGILAAVERLRPVTVHRVEIRRPRWLPARLLSALTNQRWNAAAILRGAFGVDAATLPKVDFIVSAGGDTLAANIAAGRHLGVPNIFYGSLRRFRPEDFALVLTSYARHAASPRHLVTQKPNKLDPDRVPLPALLGAQPLTAGLLVGGDAGTMTFSNDDWDRLLAFVRAESAAQGTRWIVSNSRRTPDTVSDTLARLAAEPNSPIERFIDIRRAGPGTLLQLFAASSAIVTTVDSSSMLSEAIWVRRPTLAVSPDQGRLPADEQDYRRFLEGNGWCASLPIRELTPESFRSALSRLTPMRDNPMDQLARSLARALPQLFGS